MGSRMQNIIEKLTGIQEVIDETHSILSQIVYEMDRDANGDLGEQSYVVLVEVGDTIREVVHVLGQYTSEVSDGH